MAAGRGPDDDTLQRAVREAVREAAGWPDVRVDEPFSVRAYSRMHVASSPDGRRVAVKCCLRPDGGGPDAATAERQYDALERVDRALRPRGGDRLGVPRPVFLAPAVGAYGMGWSEGRPLTQLIERGGSDLTERLHGAGRWLAAFHAAGPLRHGDSGALASKPLHVETMAANPLRERVFAGAIERLRRTAPAAGQPIRVSWLHGDFKPDNLLVDGERIVGIDLSLGHENAVEHDLAQFLHALRLQCVRRRPFASRVSAPALRAAFLAGYAAEGGMHSPSLLDWLELWTTVVAWHNQRTERGMRGWWGSRGMRTLVEGLLADGA